MRPPLDRSYLQSGFRGPPPAGMPPFNPGRRPGRRPGQHAPLRAQRVELTAADRFGIGLLLALIVGVAVGWFTVTRYAINLLWL